ncbi:hypothetical protein [Roseivirga sp.]|uniref:hypothetical protein n=1 Tax=Roseivirga sp. TaxID=1964215 RepID=UPI003B516969
MLKKSLVFCLTIIVIISGFSQAKAQTVLEDSVMNGNNFQKAAFRLWIGSETESVTGVIVLVPGSNGNGRTMVEKPEWQALANKYNMALLAAHITDQRSENMAIERYVNVSQESGQAMLDILDRLADKSGHPEIKKAPLAFWGMSAGGQFNYEFACWKPERVISFIVNKGGVYYTALASKATRQVPGVFLTGEIDNPYRNEIVEGIYAVNRRFGAKWMFAEEPGQGHEFAKSEAFALKYFDLIIPIRMQESGLTPLPSSGYLASIENHDIIEDSTRPRPRGVTSWFPNRQIAELWLTLFDQNE